jgi:hypothetical protein
VNLRFLGLVTVIALHSNQIDEDELVVLTLGVATGRTTKAEVAVFLAGRIRGG